MRTAEQQATKQLIQIGLQHDDFVKFYPSPSNIQIRRISSILEKHATPQCKTSRDRKSTKQIVQKQYHQPQFHQMNPLANLSSVQLSQSSKKRTGKSRNFSYQFHSRLRKQSKKMVYDSLFLPPIENKSGIKTSADLQHYFNKNERKQS